MDFNFRSHDVIGHLFLRCHHHDAAEERSKPSRRKVTGRTFRRILTAEVTSVGSPIIIDTHR